ncbi:sugar transporter [Roseicyclus marinus]
MAETAGPPQAAQAGPVVRPGHGGAGAARQQNPDAAPAALPRRPMFRPNAGPARLRRRHFGLMLSFLVVVTVPLFVIAVYLYTFAQDQFASTAGFTVRAEEAGAATDLLGGLAGFGGAASATSDGDILYEFITSRELVQRLNDRMDLVGHYAAPYRRDPVFALEPDAPIEALVNHWQRVVRVSYTRSSGLIDVEVLAFDPVTAHTIAQAIVEESQRLINELNDQARADAMRFAEADLEAAIARLRMAREALTAFRTRTQIVDPQSDIQGRSGVLNNLQQQLAEALIDFDLLSENTTNPSDPRLVQAMRRIEVIDARIRQERANFVTDEVGIDGEDYPTLMAQFEGLTVDREFAEQAYRAALTALDVARTNSARQSRYLAVYIRPSLPESAGFPRREAILGLSLMFLVLGWAIMALVYYSIRDRQ